MQKSPNLICGRDADLPIAAYTCMFVCVHVQQLHTHTNSHTWNQMLIETWPISVGMPSESNLTEMQTMLDTSNSNDCPMHTVLLCESLKATDRVHRSTKCCQYGLLISSRGKCTLLSKDMSTRMSITVLWLVRSHCQSGGS